MKIFIGISLLVLIVWVAISKERSDSKRENRDSRRRNLYRFGRSYGIKKKIEYTDEDRKKYGCGCRK